nr:DUF4430 domain-containing protein [Clostridia bacterium]
MTKNRKTTIIAVAVLAALVAIFAVVAIATRPETDSSSKNVTVEVIMADGSSKEFTAKTDAEFLGTVLLDELKLVEGEMGDYGLYIKTVNGYTANDANQEWWCLTKGGEDVMTGADSTPIYDGDKFELTLNVGYDQY